LNVWYTATSIASSSGLPLFNQCLSWIILGKCSVTVCVIIIYTTINFTRLRYGDGAGNTVEENSSVFSLI